LRAIRRRILPGLAVSARRLRLQWTFRLVLLAFTVIGVLLLLYWACVRGTVGPKRLVLIRSDKKKPREDARRASRSNRNAE